VGFLVVGTARSGTTLVQRLACELEGVKMPPETHFFSDFASGLWHRREFPIGEPALRDEIEAFSKLDNTRGLNIEVDRLVEEMGGSCGGVYEMFDATVRHLSGKSDLWGEKTPGHLWWWPAIAQVAPWIRFIVVVRDPRAVVASGLSTPWADRSDLEAWGNNVHIPLAARWEFDQEVTEALLKALGPQRSVVLRYEDIVSDPGEARSKIAGLIGLGEEKTLQQAPTDLIHPWEEWKQRALEDITTERLDTWRADLGPQRAAEISALCTKGMVRFGYSAERPTTTAPKMNKENRRLVDNLFSDWRTFEARIAKMDL
jgi:hypothetical protein